MGVISVGASLGVKDDAGARAIRASAASSAAPPRVRRSPTAVKKQPLRRRSSATIATAGGSATNATTSTTAAPSASTSNNHNSVLITPAQPPQPLLPASDDAGQWQVTRVVSVATALEPQLLLPHVIGARGARINAIMSQAKCVVAHRRRDGLVPATEARGGGFSVTFQVSAENITRVRR